MKKSCVMFISALSLAVFAQSLYQTGFESDGEPFGNWKAGNTVTRGGATTVKAYSGKSSMSPGYGNGRYGAGKTLDFEQPLQAEKLWISYWQYVDKPVNYAGYLYVFGKSSDGGKVRLLNSIVTGNSIRLGFPQRGYRTAPLSGKWHRHEYLLDFKKQTFNVYLDGKLIAADVNFEHKARGSAAEISNVFQILLGGNGSRTDATFYDDFYIGTERAPEKLGGRMEKVSGKVDTRVYMQIGRVSGASPVLDGKLDDKCWANAAVFSPMVKNNHQKSANHTQAYAAYDEKNLYIAVKAMDEDLDPVKNQLDQIIKGRTGANARAWTADSIELFIAPEQSSPDKYFHFCFNLAGGYDAFHPLKSNKWQSGVKSAAQINDHFWGMEIIIPLKDLGISGTLAGKNWAFNLCRNKRGGKQQGIAWSPTNASYHSYGKFGEIGFVEHAPRIELAEKAVSTGKEGSNDLHFKITADKDQQLVFRNYVSYKGADTVAGENTVQVKAGKTAEIQNSYFVSAGTPARKSSDSFSCYYEILDGSGKLIQRSAAAAFPLERYAPLKSKFMCTTSNIIFKYFENLYINQGAVRPMLLMLQADPKILPGIKSLNMQIEMPEYISILALDAKDKKSCIPSNIKEKIISRNGKKYRVINMDIDRKYLYGFNEIGLGKGQSRYNNWTLFTFDCAKNAPTGSGEKITYSISTAVNGKTYRSHDSTLELHILPQIKGAKIPSSYMLLLDSFPQFRILNCMSHQERERFLADFAGAGINSTGFNEKTMEKDLFRLFRKYGFSVRTGIPVNKAANYMSHAFPGAKEYLKKHPEYRAVDRSGKIHDDGICFEFIIQKNSPYDREMLAWITPLAGKFAGLDWDYEVPPARGDSFCFCGRCLEAFAKYAGLKAPVTRDDAATKYLKQWTVFQAKRVAEICGKLYKAVKKANPACEWGFYSGYQSANTLNAYSVDWRYCGPFIDRAIAGYGRPLQAIKDTRAATGDKKLTLGLLMLVWHGSQYDYTQFKNSLWRRITDSNGGVLFFADMQIDGRFFDAVAGATRVIKDNFEFFNNYRRGDELCRVSGTNPDNMAVLRNDAGERVIVLFNALGKDNKYTLENFNIPSGAKLKDAFTGKVCGDPAKAVITVPANDVAVLTLKK